jgi:hypothetical protein
MPPTRLDGPNLLAINVGARLGVSGAPMPVRADAEFAAALASMTVTMMDDTARSWRGRRAPRCSATR